MPVADGANLAPRLPAQYYNDDYEIWTTETLVGDAVVERDVLITAHADAIQDMSRLALKGAADTGEQGAEGVNGYERRRREPELVRLADGRLLEKIHYFDTPGHEDMTDVIARARADRYNEARWLENPDTEDAGGMRGSNVEIFAYRDHMTGQIIASVRLYHGSKPKQMPSYAKALKAGALSPEGIAEVEEVTKGRPVAEVGDLWGLKDEYRQEVDEDGLPPCPPDAIFKLYTWVAELTMKRNGVLIVGAVGPEAQGLLRHFGPHVVRVLGRRFPVGDLAASKKVMLTPIMMDPRAAPKNLVKWVYEGIEAATQALTLGKKIWIDRHREARRRHVRLMDITEIAPPELIDSDLRAALWDVRRRLDQLRSMKHDAAA